MFHLQLSDDTPVEADRPSPKDTLSMPFIKRHIRRRLTNAKDSCDKELRKVVNSITEYVETRLRERTAAQDALPVADSADPFAARGHSHSASGDLNEEALADDTEPEDVHVRRHSRRVSVSQSASSSPSSLRRHPTLPRNSQAELSPGKSKTITTPSSSTASYAQSGVSRRLSRNMHLPIMHTRSDSNSRSHSRSRSPLPPTNAEMSVSPRSASGFASRRLSRFDFDTVQLPQDHFMATIHDIISIATDIIDTPISTLITQPKTCAEFVQKVQKVGRAWDEHPDWQGRGWYVQLLLAVAGLSRVVEWWEAEKQFWNFEDDNDEEMEPLTFVLKPEDEEAGPGMEVLNDDPSAPTTGSTTLERRVSRVEGSHGKISRRSSIGSARTSEPMAIALSDPPLIRSLTSGSARNSMYNSRSGSMERVPTCQTPLSMTEFGEEGSTTIMAEDIDVPSSPEKFRARATEKLRVQAEEAQSSNIVLELGLESEQIMWANQAWEDVIGSRCEDLVGTSMTDLLAPEDKTVFKEAIHLLREDCSQTVEAKFRMRVEGPSTPVTPVEGNADDDTASTDSTTSAAPHPTILEPPPQPPKRPGLRKAFSSILRPTSSSSFPAISSPTPLTAVNTSVSLPLLDTAASPLPKPVAYRDFEGKGMLMLDRTTGAQSHTMWVIKPVSEPEIYDPSGKSGGDNDESGDEFAHLASPGFRGRITTDPGTSFPFSLPVSSQLILCRICEANIPEWFFEKHNETCAESHRLEAVVSDCNESIQDLRSTIKDFIASLDRDRERLSSTSALGPTSTPMTGSFTAPEYRGMPIFTSSSISSNSTSGISLASSLQLFRPQIGSKKKKKLQGAIMHRGLLQMLDDVLLATLEISTPALKEDQSAEPLERQRLLSPTSESKIKVVAGWKRPLSMIPHDEEPAVTRLVQDVEMLIRTKLDNVKRLENTIIYSEKIRQEWEEMVQRAISQMAVSEAIQEEDEGEEEAEAGEGGDDGRLSQSSTRSEYAYDGQEEPPSTSMEPTPIGTHTPARTPSTGSMSSVILIPNLTAATVSQGLGLSNPPPTNRSSTPPAATLPAAAPAPAPPLPPVVPATWQGIGFSHTRSSTPSSMSSPLALAAPIVGTGGHSPGALHHPIPQNISIHSLSGPLSTSSLQLDKPANPVDSSSQTIRARPSGQNLTLEHKTGLTPPLSPLISPKEGLSISHPGHSRRQSGIFPIISPTNTGGSGPLSPRIPSLAPASRSAPSSIKDFDILKPISKGAFGAVFLAKKKSTGDYYAIKVLRKADMIAKNQITNVKAERRIMMRQAESPFVVKLYFTFQSRDNLYLVMEYLNGGDCAALIKSLGCLPEEWTRGYVAEIVLGLEYLHATGVVHRDLKPDNLLIDQHGHLKLTDFGLSHIGLLGRQTQTRTGGLNLAGVDRIANMDRPKKHSPSSRHTSMDSTYFVGSPMIADTTLTSLSPSYFNPRIGNVSTDNVSESSGSDGLGSLSWPKTPGIAKPYESPLQSFATDLANDLRSHSTSGTGTPPGEQKFVGTPDYLAPESILGLSDDDRAVDWWAVGVITYEFLYGMPPFHDETPDKVFANIINRKIEWHEDLIDFTPEAMDFMNRLMTSDPKQRLGSNGAAEVKQHGWLREIDWDTVTTTEAQFIPQITDPESTDYFDPRGALPQLFQDDDAIEVTGRPEDSPQATPAAARNSNSSPANDDFGTFNFKNLPVLQRANEDVIKQLKGNHSATTIPALADPVQMHRRRSVSVRKPQNLITNADPRTVTSPPSPSTSTSSIASSPSRGSMPPSTPGSTAGHNRRPSEFGPLERFRQHHLDDGSRRNSLPSRLRTSSMSSVEQEDPASEQWRNQAGTPATSIASQEMRRVDEEPRPVKHERTDQAVTCLIAEDNPISLKIMETLLTRMGCRCVLVHDGAEAISVALGDIKFDCIFMDYHMPIMDGETAARYIKNTNNKNTNVPIVSISAYSHEASVNGNLYAAALSKPVQKGDIVTVLRQLGFKTAEGQKGKVVR